MKLKQRPYIIINNKRSDLIEGLLITNSPTISKPPKRVNIEEVDGKDGYFINELGFSGYDKEVGIGLYGNYNIDNVIGYLSQNGTIVFSTSPALYLSRILAFISPILAPHSACISTALAEQGILPLLRCKIVSKASSIVIKTILFDMLLTSFLSLPYKTPF